MSDRMDGYEGEVRATATRQPAGGLRPEPLCGVSAEGAHQAQEVAKVIFLDIDGPMIPATMFLIDRMCSWNRRFPAHTIAVMNRLCENTGAKIVLNTTHNNPMKGVPDIEVALVEQGLAAEHLHPTDLKTRYPSINRRLAVRDWLAAHPEVTHWVALDDVICADEPNMIVVDPDAGLHVGHLNLATEILEGRQCIILL